jgi:hypothetical protein
MPTARIGSALRLPLLVLLAAHALSAQAAPAKRICPSTLGIYPALLKEPDLPLSRRARFELRICENNSPVQLVGFRSGELKPFLALDTLAALNDIEMVIHRGSILVLQVGAGSSSPVYIAQFQRGKPVLVSQEDGVGGVSYSEENGDTTDYAIIAVPLKPMGDFRPHPPHRFRLRIHNEP